MLRAKGYDVAVENAGISGDTAKAALARLEQAIGPDTDIVLVEFGTNDLRRDASAADVRARVSTIVRTLRARGIQVLVIGLGQLDLSVSRRR